MSRLKAAKPAAAETAHGLQEMTSFAGKVSSQANPKPIKVQVAPGRVRYRRNHVERWGWS
jgi:hypothetical protein